MNTIVLSNYYNTNGPTDSHLSTIEQLLSNIIIVPAHSSFWRMWCDLAPIRPHAIITTACYSYPQFGSKPVLGHENGLALAVPGPVPLYGGDWWPLQWQPCHTTYYCSRTQACNTAPIGAQAIISTSPLDCYVSTWYPARTQSGKWPRTGWAPSLGY